MKDFNWLLDLFESFKPCRIYCLIDPRTLFSEGKASIERLRQRWEIGTSSEHLSDVKMKFTRYSPEIFSSPACTFIIFFSMSFNFFFPAVRGRRGGCPMITSSNIGKTTTTNQYRRVPNLRKAGRVKIKRYYTKSGRLIPTQKRGKENKAVKLKQGQYICTIFPWSRAGGRWRKKWKIKERPGATFKSWHS